MIQLILDFVVSEFRGIEFKEGKGQEAIWIDSEYHTVNFILTPCEVREFFWAHSYFFVSSGFQEFFPNYNHFSWYLFLF